MAGLRTSSFYKAFWGIFLLNAAFGFSSCNKPKSNTAPSKAALAITPSVYKLAVGNEKIFKASGGTAPYTITVFGDAALGSVAADPAILTQATFTALAEGTITVRVTDAAGTTKDCVVTIVAQPVISATTTKLSASVPVGNGMYFPSYTTILSTLGGVPPITYSKVSADDGFVNSSQARYRSRTSEGTSIVRATDAIGNMDEIEIAVYAPPTITPSTASVIDSLTEQFSASSTYITEGGTYTFSVSSGSGSIDSSTGEYTAVTPTGTAKVRVTDDLGGYSEATVTVLPKVGISPMTKDLKRLGTVTFTSSGGTGPYVYEVIEGLGAVDPNTGEFTADDVAGTVKVQSKDSNDMTSVATVTVYDPPAFDGLPTEVLTNSITTLSATGGLAPYTFRKVGGVGGLSANVYAAPSSAGTVTLEVKDALGGVAVETISVSYGALTIAPATTDVTVSTTSFFTASGGVPPYTFTIEPSGVSLANTLGIAEYMAPASPGSVTIRVTDSAASPETADAVVSVYSVPAISPSSATIALPGTETFSASGGLADYTFSLVSGSGSIDPSTGVYTPATPGAAVVKVTDSLGASSQASVTVTGTLTLSPATLSMTVYKTQTFTASGGNGPYTYSIESGDGSINPSTGAFTAPSSEGSVTIKAVDAYSSGTATVTVYSAPAISPASASVAIGATQQFSVSGGLGPYTYGKVSGGGSIDSSGLYTAALPSGSAVIRVTDGLNSYSEATVTVTGGLTVAPSEVSLALNGTADFVPSGVAPYTYSVVEVGGGTVDGSGHYVAPGTPGTYTVRVTDATTTIGESIVHVYGSPTISPAAATLAIGESTAFSASGGLAPYSYTLVSGGGSVNAGSGVYTADLPVGPASVKVTDALGGTSTASVTVVPILTISPSTATVVLSGTKQFTGSGGDSSSYTYSILSGGGSVNSTGLFTAAASAGETKVRVTDAGNRTADATVTVSNALAVSPTQFVNSQYYAYILAGGDQIFDIQGGTPGYTCTKTGGGTLDTTSIAAGQCGLTAPSTAGTATLTVQDSAASKATVTVNVTYYDALTISATTDVVQVSNKKSYNVTGGVAPLTMSVSSGLGSVSPTTAPAPAPSTASPLAIEYSAPASAGTATVLVTDAIGNTASINIRIADGLVIAPLAVTLATYTDFTFSTSGAVGAVSYANVGVGTIGVTTGIYNSTSVTAAGAPDTVTVTDTVPTSSVAKVTVVKPTKIVSGDTHTCALFTNGGVKCWGSSLYGQLGTGSATNLGDGANEMGGNLPWINLGTGFVADDIVAGSFHTCAHDSVTNKIKCWGRNASGQLGLGLATSVNIGDAASEMSDGLAFINVGANRTVKKVFAGSSTTCAILDNDTLKCWGYNKLGGCGQNNTTNPISSPPASGVSLGSNPDTTSFVPSSLAISLDAVCAMSTAGAVKCWGSTTADQLGYATANGAKSVLDPSLSTTVVNLGTNKTAKKIVGGYQHFCSILNDNTLKCWGKNANGQLGQDSNSQSILDPSGMTAISLGSTVTNVNSGLYHVCAILATSPATAKCWGKNTVGQLGRGNTTDAGTSGSKMSTVTALSLGTNFTPAVISTGSTFTCALTTNASVGDRVKCFGGAAGGALGDGQTANNRGDAGSEMGDTLPFVAL